MVADGLAQYQASPKQMLKISWDLTQNPCKPQLRSNSTRWVHFHTPGCALQMPCIGSNLGSSQES